LILPLFVRTGQNIRQPISAMPGNFQLSIDELVKEAPRALFRGYQNILFYQ